MGEDFESDGMPPKVNRTPIQRLRDTVSARLDDGEGERPSRKAIEQRRHDNIMNDW